LLRERGVEPEVVKYLEDPPDRGTLDRLLTMLGMEPRELLRTREREYEDLGLNDTALTRDELITAMVEHPRLIERPIVVSGDRAVLGRPTDRVLEVLGD
jgi:arsenate reductase